MRLIFEAGPQKEAHPCRVKAGQPMLLGLVDVEAGAAHVQQDVALHWFMLSVAPLLLLYHSPPFSNCSKLTHNHPVPSGGGHFDVLGVWGDLNHFCRNRKL